MARYRRFDPRFWKDEKVRQLSLTEKCIAIYSFTAQSNRIGLFSFSPGEASEDLEMLPQTFAKGFGKVCLNLSFGWDSHSRVLYLPTWWKYNCPENPNVLKACLADLHEVPTTPLLSEFSENVRYLPETFHETFREGLPKPSWKVTYISPDTDTVPASDLDPDRSRKKDSPAKQQKLCYGEFQNVRLASDELAKLTERFGEVGANQRIENLSGYIASKGKKYSSHYATILQWEAKDTKGATNGHESHQRARHHQATPGKYAHLGTVIDPGGED